MRIEVDYDPSPEELAKVFWAMDSEKQAKFLQEVALVDQPSKVQYQMHSVGVELRTKHEAREMLEDILYFCDHDRAKNRNDNARKDILEAWPNLPERTLAAMLELVGMSTSMQVSWKSGPAVLGAKQAIIPEIDLRLDRIPVSEVNVTSNQIVEVDGVQVGEVLGGVIRPDGTMDLNVLLRNYTLEQGKVPTSLSFVMEPDVPVQDEGARASWKDLSCPDCNGTGEYRGLTSVEPCQRCQS